MFAERQYWQDVADRFVKENVTVKPNRGNIISSDGKLMASSLPEYRIYMDFKAGGVKKDTMLMNHLDEICGGLHKIFPDKSASEFKTHLKKGRKQGSRNYLIYPKRISYIQYKEAKRLSLANQNDENIAKTAEKQKKNFAGTEISGKKLGVIGLGAIGVLVANAAVHMGMDVYGYDPYISVNAAWNLSRSVKHISNVEDIYKNCDVITIHVPLLDSTKKMINADAIAMMKPTAIVLNFARDLLVDEEAMVDALAKGKVKKYVSDFPNNTTVGAKGCIVTPHLGASTAESEDNCAVMAVKELRDYLENGNIVHSVNFPDCSMGACTASGRVGILHKNVKGMIGQITTALAEADINVSDLTNKGKGDYAYSLLDLDSAIDASTVEKLSAIDGVLRVRVIK